MIEKFKENKKTMLEKMEEAKELVKKADKMAESAVEEFVNSLESLVKDASDEEFKEFLNSKDELIELDDKLSAIGLYAEKENANVAVFKVAK